MKKIILAISMMVMLLPSFVWATDGDLQAVPEPATMFLLGCGLISLIGLRRKIKE